MLEQLIQDAEAGLNPITHRQHELTATALSDCILFKVRPFLSIMLPYLPRFWTRGMLGCVRHVNERRVWGGHSDVVSDCNEL